MTERTNASRDSQLSIEATKILWDGRDPIADRASVLVTLEHLVATMLIIAMDQNHRLAVRMLNEGLVPGVEARIAMHQAKGAKP